MPVSDDLPVERCCRRGTWQAPASMAELEHLAAYRVTRPPRGLVMVAIPDGVSWQAAFMSALRGQSATWGGAGNLPVP